MHYKDRPRALVLHMTYKSKQLKWWLLGGLSFVVFVALQIPANWLIAKYFKQNQMLSNVSGNIWQGQADWQHNRLQGTVHWDTRVLDLLRMRLGANLELHSGDTQLNTVFAYGAGKKIVLENMQGEVAPETLKSIANWQWPDNKVQLKDVGLNYRAEQGFSGVVGDLTWGGGALIYSMEQRQERINVPALLGSFSDEQGKMKLDIADQRDGQLALIQLDPNFMLDVQLTQRFLLNSPSYEGKAGIDTYVFGSRQPLLQGAI